MDWAQLPVVQLGALGLLLGTVWMVFRGLLVPRWIHQERVADRDKRLAEVRAEAGEYKSAWLAAEKARHEQDNQLAELMELARTTNQAMQAVARHEEGPRNVVAP